MNKQKVAEHFEGKSSGEVIDFLKENVTTIYDNLYEQTVFQTKDYEESQQLQPNTDEIIGICDKEKEFITQALQEHATSSSAVEEKSKAIKK